MYQVYTFLVYIPKLFTCPTLRLLCVRLFVFRLWCLFFLFSLCFFVFANCGMYTCTSMHALACTCKQNVMATDDGAIPGESESTDGLIEQYKR